VLSARRAERLAEVAAAIKADGGEALVVPADVTDYEQLRNLFAQAHAQYGRIEILLNNAGPSGTSCSPTTSAARWPARR
jgi:NADP-dependent 3-hydroxy acid dehydrogenase YdfG